MVGEGQSGASALPSRCCVEMGLDGAKQTEHGLSG